MRGKLFSQILGVHLVHTFLQYIQNQQLMIFGNTYKLWIFASKEREPSSLNSFRLAEVRIFVIRCLLKSSRAAISVGIKCKRANIQILI